MQKARKKTRSTKPRIPKPTPPQIHPSEVAPKRITYLGQLKLVLTDFKFLLVLALIAVGVGIAVQINWVQLRCPTEPFFGSQVTICKDNVLRLILGGPLVLVLSLPVAALLRYLNPDITSNRIVMVFALLLPLCALPWIKTETGKTKITAVGVLLFLTISAYLTRKTLWAGIRQVFAKPEFTVSLKNLDNTTRLSLGGKLNIEERAWIYESLLDVLNEPLPPQGEICIDISELIGYDVRFIFIFHLLAGLGTYSEKKIVLNGAQEVIAEIEESLTYKFESFSYGQ